MSADSTAHDDHHDHGLSHTIPVPVLLGVFFALMFLTWLTVSTSSAESPLSLGLELGGAEMIVAMSIATIKATLVGAYFMHLRYDKPLNAILLVFSLVFVALFIVLTVSDAANYGSQLEAKPLEVAAAPAEEPAEADAAPEAATEGEAAESEENQ